jgi:hypothetical protein
MRVEGLGTECGLAGQMRDAARRTHHPINGAFRMGKKFIPNGDFDFATMAGSFARAIAADPGRFEVSPGDRDALSAAVAAYESALQASRFGARSAASTRAKDDARAAAEQIIRRLGHVVRSSLRLDAATKLALGIEARAEKAKIQPCPQEPPRLRFVRALHEGNGATPVHELDFRAFDLKAAKPKGAVRLELFVDLVPPEEPIPAGPGANHGSRPWYLRSYTRSPIKLTPPIARVPMRVVYWGRWADSLGNVGPFGATAVAWIEGGSHHALPGGPGIALGFRKPVPVIDAVPTAGPDERDESYRVAVLEMRYESMSGREFAAALPAAPEWNPARRLEGPPPEGSALVG